jgi:hypothetical protein
MIETNEEEQGLTIGGGAEGDSVQGGHWGPG